MTTELLPCPFCGNDEPAFERIGTANRSCIVSCGNCGCRHESGDEYGNSGKSWNRRAGLSQRAPTAAAEAAPVVPEFPGRVLDVIHDMADRSSRDGMAPWYDELGPMQDDADAALNWIKEASRCIALSTPQAVPAQSLGAPAELSNSVVRNIRRTEPSVEAQQAGSGGHCVYCNDTGDVHGPDGEWRGVCDCAAGKALASCEAPAEPAMVLSYEQRRAVMEAERNASMKAHERGMPLGDTGRRVYEAAFTNGWGLAMALTRGGA